MLESGDSSAVMSMHSFSASSCTAMLPVPSTLMVSPHVDFTCSDDERLSFVNSESVAPLLPPRSIASCPTKSTPSCQLKHGPFERKEIPPPAVVEEDEGDDGP